MTNPVVIVPYDPGWPARFEHERRALTGAFTGADAVVEHVGSTAVPGLGGKPILDIMIGVADLSEVETRIPRLEALGYEYVPEYEAQLPERRYFRKPPTHHLHCVVRESAFWVDHLAFRDYLREHPESAAAYYELKRALASRHRNDSVAYTEAKSAFVETILEKAG